MAENPSKLIKALDNLLPFLETSPLWLKYWIYVLVLLNFVTVGGVAVSYLVSKQAESTTRTLKNFSIDQPTNNQQIPLGPAQTWMLEGKFPRTPDEQATAPPGTLRVEVFKLPSRQAIAQTGTARISTARGLWRYESARFAGPGPYEIVATAQVGPSTDYQTVNVQCLEKGEVYKASIQKERERRGASSLVLASREAVSLPAVYAQLDALQREFFKLFPGDPQGALRVVMRTFDVLDPVLPVFPNDHYLQNVRAYSLKNYAMVEQALNRNDEAQRALGEAERTFQAVREQDPRDEGAWNGLGSVALLRGDAAGALQYIDKALELRPDYAEARHDRELAVQRLAEQRKPPPPGRPP